ncbi:Uncharacterised protein [uncultured archaeon]|nr:Uncharacterised protein [uncultured archaeon]
MRQEGANYFIDIVAVDGTSYPLAAILKTSYDMGNIKVHVQVLDRSGKPIKPSLPVGTDPVNAVLQAIKGGLAGNEYFVDAINIVGTSPPNPRSQWQIAVIFKKSVIQFFNDDISDYYSNLNAVAEDIFADVMNSEYPGEVKITFTTENTKSG